MIANRLLAMAALALAACAPYPEQAEGPWRVIAERTVGGFAFPESVGCDRGQGVLYVSQFGGTELKPAEKDGLGFISKIAPDGRMLEGKAFNVTMNKPKGIWVERGRLWVTDIDGVWIFDTRSKQGRKLVIPGAEFANDPALREALRERQPQRPGLASAGRPSIPGAAEDATVLAKKEVNPNGLWPARKSRC